SLLAPGFLAPCLLLAASYLFVRMMQGVLLGEGRLARYNESELASRVVLLAGTLALLTLDALTLASALWTVASSSAVAAAVLGVRLATTIRLGRWRDVHIARTLLHRGFQFMIA